MTIAIEIQNLKFGYQGGKPVLDIDHLVIEKGKKVFIHGPSGYGKSTLLNLMAGVLPLTEGKLDVLGMDFKKMSAGKRDEFRGEHMGYIFQSFNLIPYLTVAENIHLPLKVHPAKKKRINSEVESEIQKLCSVLRISELLNKKVTHLSIGQQQRVAAARAILGNPDIVIADEPTSSLDQDNTREFMKLLMAEWELKKFTLIFVSHDERLKEYFDEAFSLADFNKVNPQ